MCDSIYTLCIKLLIFSIFYAEKIWVICCLALTGVFLAHCANTGSLFRVKQSKQGPWCEGDNKSRGERGHHFNYLPTGSIENAKFVTRWRQLENLLIGRGLVGGGRLTYPTKQWLPRTKGDRGDSKFIHFRYKMIEIKVQNLY